MTYKTLSWLYHHCASHRNIKIGQVSKIIDKFKNKKEQIQCILDFKNESNYLEKKARVYKHDYPIYVSEQIPIVEYANSQNSKSKFLYNLSRYGYSILNTRKSHILLPFDEILNWLIPNEYPMSTMYGLIWDVVDNKQDAINLAYTNHAIDFHQDLTYYNPPPTIQILYCLQQAQTGGETLLKNVYNAALEFRHLEPEAFDVLSCHEITYQKVHYERDSPYHLMRSIPIMELNKNELIRVNWSPFVEGFTPSNDLDSWEEFYECYFLWKNYIDNRNGISIKLKPGQMLAFHNHHMLHGRNSFVGSRHLSGCYLSYEQYTNLLNIDRVGINIKKMSC